MIGDPEIPFSPITEDFAREPAEHRATAVQLVDELPLFAHQTPNHIPHLGHAAIFGLLIVVGILQMAILLGIILGLHLVGRASIDQLAKSAVLIIPVMAFAYITIAALCFPVFGLIWKQPFITGIHLNFNTARRALWRLLATGVGIGLAVQWLSNYLPIPKSLPIDDFFKTSSSVWMVAFFGVFIAPVFEELAFRGFLLPALANGWDWLVNKVQRLPPSTDVTAADRPRWSATAIVLATVLTSVAFMLIHADQLAHAWAPLAVLFTVSVLLCAVRIRTDSLAASILVHASYNFSIFATLFLATDGFRHLEKMHT